MRKSTKKKIAPVVVAAVMTLVLLPIVLIILAAMGIVRFAEADLQWIVLPILGVYALVVAAVIVGVLTAMRQRLREIDGGEEDEAKKY